MAEKPRIVGIDLGTTNTLVASVRNRIPKVVPPTGATSCCRRWWR